MKQLNLFETASNAQQQEKIHYWKLYCDGAARNNPGPAGAGIVIKKDEEVVVATGIFLGNKTNNQAEYYALIFGLHRLAAVVQPSDLVLVISDSQLLIRQLEGKYRVKESHLKPLYNCAKTLLSCLHAELAHVLREENCEADEQANEAIDKKIQPPHDFITMLNDHEIHF